MRADPGSPSGLSSSVGTVRERRETFAVPATSLTVLVLSLVMHWLVTGTLTLWVVMHFIALGLAVLVSVYLWATASR